MKIEDEVKRRVRPRARAAAAVWVAALVTAAASVSDARDGETSDWERPSSTCDPTCRSGYECRRGECTPVCSPACGEGSLCSADGGCVSAQPVAAPVAPAAPQPPSRAAEASDTCEPVCRSGFTCRQSRCVSLCNPLCPADEICTADGECVSGHVADHLSTFSEPDAGPRRDASADALVNLHVDAAGLLQFGLTPTLEVGETFSGYLRLRIINTGLASYFLLGRDADDELGFGAGAALGMHWFSAERGNMRGLYGGAALEYVFLETRDETVDFARYRTHALIPQVDLGYRWAFGDFFVGVSGKLGLAIPLRNQAVGIGETPCPRPESCSEDLSVALVPGIGVDLGWFIAR